MLSFWLFSHWLASQGAISAHQKGPDGYVTWGNNLMPLQPAMMTSARAWSSVKSYVP
jgi:hypothetical protein